MGASAPGEWVLVETQSCGSICPRQRKTAASLISSSKPYLGETRMGPRDGSFPECRSFGETGPCTGAGTLKSVKLCFEGLA